MSVIDISANQQEIKATLQRFKMVMTAYVEERHLKNYLFEIESAFDTDFTILKLFYKPFGEILDSIQYPKNWKEAIKEALYKRFKLSVFQKKYPVQYIIYNVNVYYPDISLPDEKHVITFKEAK
jgi:hypothetical protein